MRSLFFRLGRADAQVGLVVIGDECHGERHVDFVQLAEAAVDGAADLAAQVFQAALDLVQIDGGVLLALFEGGEAADVALAGDGGGHAVEATGDGAGLVEQAAVVIAQQGAAALDARGFFHDGFGALAGLFFPEELALEAGQMTVGLGGPGQDGRALRTVVESLLESPVDVHGLHQGKVEQGMTAIAAAFLAGDALGMVVPDTFEHGVTAGAEFFVFGKNGLKIRNHWGRSAGYESAARRNARRHFDLQVLGHP